MARQYAAFISYRHRPLDIAVATSVHKSIERFKIPRDLRREEQKHPGSVFKNWDGQPPEGGLLVFRDREELPLSNDLTADIFEALDNAKCLIVVCTPDTPKSLWVRREISHFIEKHGEEHGRKRIITVLAAGAPEESIPEEITTRYAEDGVTVLEEYEPLVAYLVADSRRKVLRNLRKERLRLCAALLGCPFDSLRQRHKRWKMQQAFAASAAAFLVALSFIGMLVNRNQEIEAQKRSVQLRESELLAADAREALDIGNTRTAIESAVSALPKAGDEDRPYYAPAESVLMEAMDVLGGAEDHVLLSDTVLEQMTPISHFDLSMDGTLAVTIDDYGVVHCFDTVTGQEKWSDIVANDDASPYTSYVRISADESCLLCQYGTALEGRDLQTGRLYWNYDMRLAADGYFIFDDAKNQTALLRSFYSAEDGTYRTELEILSAQTGEVMQNILLERYEAVQYQTFHNTSQTRLPTGGIFSEDSRYFACAFFRDLEEAGKSELVCFVADLQEGSLVTNYIQEIPFGDFTVSNMEFRENELLIALEFREDTVAGSVLKLDWQTGQLLWNTITPAELEGYSSSSDLTSYVLFWNNIAILGRYEKLYAIDLQTGEILDSIQLPGTLSAMYTVSSSYFGFSLEEGTYAIGWYNTSIGFALTTEYFYQVTANIGAHSKLLPYGGGIVQQFTDGNYLEISVSNIEREGYLAVVPAEQENQLVIKRPITIEKTITASAVSVPVDFDSFSCTDSHSVLLQDNTLILGQFCGYDQDWNYRYFHIALDPVTHEVQNIYETDGNPGTSHFFLKDGSGYLRYDRTGTTTLVQNGAETVLAEKRDSRYPEDWQSYVWSMVSTDSAYLSDGTVMTAHCDTQTLTLLKDGVEIASVPLPASHLYSEEMDTAIYRFVKAGRNGYVVTHFTSLLEPLSAEDVAFYDVAGGTWLQPELAPPLTNTNAYAFAADAPLFAAADTHHMIRILDLQTGTETAAFPLQLPYGSVLHMDFLLEDHFLMVKTKDAQVLIYDIATGEILFRDQLTTAYSGTLTAWEDTASQRLYILDSSQSGDCNTLCIDLRSWTTLARAENMLFYIPQTNELYHTQYTYGSSDSLFFFRIPDTGELVQLGQQLLSAK